MFMSDLCWAPKHFPVEKRYVNLMQGSAIGRGYLVYLVYLC